MSVKRRFKQVDVFTANPLKGNPLAVVLDASGMSDEQMAAFARWTNLSETTFVLPATDASADYWVRIFTLEDELPFAGHPTLGTAHALLEAGLVPKTPGQLIQQCGAGLVTIKILPEGRLAFAAPEAKITALNSELYPLLDTVLQGSKRLKDSQAYVVKVGIPWLIVRMNSAEECLQAKLDGGALQELQQQSGAVGITLFGPHPQDDELDYEVRALLVQHSQLMEDPVTGSANACLARLLAQQNFPDGGKTSAHYRARQGTAMQRDGRIFVSYDEHGQPWIGGEVCSLIDGSLDI